MKFIIDSLKRLEASLDNFLKFSNELKYKESNVPSNNFVEFIKSLYSFSIFFDVVKAFFIWSFIILLLSFLFIFLTNISSVFELYYYFLFCLYF